MSGIDVCPPGRCGICPTDPIDDCICQQFARPRELLLADVAKKESDPNHMMVWPGAIRAASKGARSHTRPAGDPAPRRPPRRPPVEPGRPIRVGFACAAFVLGGAEWWHITLIPRLQARGLDVVGLAVWDTNQVEPDMIAKLTVPVSYGRAGAVALAGAVDVLVTWGPMPRGDLVGALAGRPAVVSVSHGDESCTFSKSWMAEAAPHSDWLVACSTAGRRTVPAHRWGDMEVIHNGIDLGRLVPTRSRAEARADWGVPAGCRVLGYAGRFARDDKRADLVATVGRHLPAGWRVVMVGDGYAADQVRALAAADPLGRTVVRPRVERIGDVLVGFDALANPSVNEGFGLSMAEALMSYSGDDPPHKGIPVVATEAGFAAEFPWMVEPVARGCTAADLAAAVVRLDADPGRTRDRSARAFDACRSMFGADAFADRWAARLRVMAGLDPLGARRSAATGVVPLGGPPAPDVAALVAGLADVEVERIKKCIHKTTRETCCDPAADYCTRGRGRWGYVGTVDCALCVRDSGDR